VKIKTSTDIFQARIGEKADTGSSQSGGQGQNPYQKPHEKEEDQPTFKVTVDEVSKAIDAFGSETAAVQNGLKASLRGDGPGLKVVLKDGSGAVIRQFTGEEFLKLREEVAKEGRSRGKILDQKL
jgi:uncharacterized FlaG/YvyC family protein